MQARKLDAISYDEMLELASVGAGVMHSRSIEFAKKFHVPLQVRSSFSDVEGTWIVPEADWMKEVVVCGAAFVRDEARVYLESVPDQPGVSHRIFSVLAEHNLVVDMIAQNAGSGGRAAIGFTVLKNDLPATLALLRPLAAELGAQLRPDDDVSKVSIVGTGMRTHSGVAERMFAALAAAEINIKMITTGDIKISVLVSKGDGIRALRAVHEAFKLEEPRLGAGLSGPGVASAFPARLPANVEEPSDKNLMQRTSQLASMEDIVISAILLNTEEGRIAIFDLPDRTGNCSKVFQAVASAGIVVDMIVQNLSSPGRAELSFSVPRADLTAALEKTRQAAREMDPQTRVVADADIARLFVFGVGMRTHTGVARRMFGSCGEAEHQHRDDQHQRGLCQRRRRIGAATGRSPGAALHETFSVT